MPQNSATCIDRIHAREVFDSRGKPTVEVEVTCANGARGRAIVPSGASTGQFEAHELRDGGERLNGAGVRRAVANVREEIAAALVGADARDQSALDRRLCELDGTADKSRLGANAILGVSLAGAHAAAAAQQIELVEHLFLLWCREVDESLTTLKSITATDRDPNPRLIVPRLQIPLPMVNMISGGMHAGGNLDLQDFLILPVGAASYREALDWIVDIYHRLGKVLNQQGLEGTLVGDEGGYGPRLNENRQALDLLMTAIETAGLRPGADVAIGLDVASTHFYENGRYRLTSEGRELTSAEMVDLLAGWVETYPIISIEDGLADDDWEGWRLLTERLGNQVQLIGDDLFVTNEQRLQQGIERKIANSVLVKVNQIGTLSETFATLRRAVQAGCRPVISARSGETEDATIADLAVATAAGQIKIGSVARSERLAKYNQLLRLEEQLASRAGFAGGAVFDGLQGWQAGR